MPEPALCLAADGLQSFLFSIRERHRGGKVRPVLQQPFARARAGFGPTPRVGQALTFLIDVL